MSGGRKWMRSEPHDVYVIEGASGDALYVGMSVAVERRLLQHRQRSWFASATSVTVSSYQDWDTAKRAEAVAIRELTPTHNSQREDWSARRATGAETATATRKVAL